MFAKPDWSRYPRRKPFRRWVAGRVHGVAHLAVLLVTLWYVATESWITIPPDPPEWGSTFVFSLIVLLVGVVVGGVVFGACLLFSNSLFGFYRTEAYSAPRNLDHKSFLRFHIGTDGMMVYSIGISRVGRGWRRGKRGEQIWGALAGGGPWRHLIEKKWTIR